MKREGFKYVSWYSLIIITGVFILYSCKKESPSEATVSTSTNMTANIGGQNMTFNASSILYNNYTHAPGIVRTMVVLADINGNSDEYQLEFFIDNYNLNYIGSYKLVGHSYNIANSFVQYQFGPYYPGGPPVFQATYYSDSINNGVFNITSYNQTYQTVSGNFSFKGYQFYPINTNYSDSLTISGTFITPLINSQ